MAGLNPAHHYADKHILITQTSTSGGIIPKARVSYQRAEISLEMQPTSGYTVY